MLLSTKLDILQKHVGCYMTIVATINVVIKDWFYNKDAFHNKNKRIYTKRGNELVLIWFNLKLIKVPKTINSLYKHFSFVKPWLIVSDKIWSF